jgi:hypothetical protein
MGDFRCGKIQQALKECKTEAIAAHNYASVFTGNKDYNRINAKMA